MANTISTSWNTNLCHILLSYSSNVLSVHSCFPGNGCFSLGIRPQSQEKKKSVAKLPIRQDNNLLHGLGYYHVEWRQFQPLPDTSHWLHKAGGTAIFTVWHSQTRWHTRTPWMSDAKITISFANDSFYPPLWFHAIWRTSEFWSTSPCPCFIRVTWFSTLSTV